MHEYRWGVLSCVVMLWYLQSFPCRIVTNLWRNCLTFYYWVTLCKHESLIEAAVDLSLNAAQSDPAYISCVATSGEVTERCVSNTHPRSLLLYSIHLCSPRIRAWRGAWFSVSANSLQVFASCMDKTESDSCHWFCSMCSRWSTSRLCRSFVCSACVSALLGELRSDASYIRYFIV